MSDQNLETAIPIACDLSAIPADQRETHTADGQALFKEVFEVRELVDGYAFRLPMDSATLMRAAEFVAYERLCCPFWHFWLEVEPGSAGLWVHLRGGVEIKTFTGAEIGAYLNEDVARRAGLGTPP